MPLTNLQSAGSTAIVLFHHVRNAPDQSVYAKDIVFACHGQSRVMAGVQLSGSHHSGGQLAAFLTRAWSILPLGIWKCITTSQLRLEKASYLPTDLPRFTKRGSLMEEYPTGLSHSSPSSPRMMINIWTNVMGY